MQSIKNTIKASVAALLSSVGAFDRDFRKRTTIVAFHRVNNAMPPDGITCTAEIFDQFCVFFKEHFRVVRLSEQIAAATAGVETGGTLSITFDDGYRDNVEVAAPILLRHSLPATFFLTSDFIGSDFVPFWDADLSPHPGWMTWEQIRHLVACGFDIGCHTRTHIDMGSANPDLIRSELTASKDKLEVELQIPISMFVYPFGGKANINEDSLQMVREAGFSCCASCYGGTNDALLDPFNLKRVGIGKWFASPQQFGLEMYMRRV